MEKELTLDSVYADIKQHIEYSKPQNLQEYLHRIHDRLPKHWVGMFNMSESRFPGNIIHITIGLTARDITKSKLYGNQLKQDTVSTTKDLNKAKISALDSFFQIYRK